MRIGLTAALVLVVLTGAAWAEGIKALSASDILRGRFVQERHLAGFAAPLKSEGSFLLAPAEGLVWQAEKPFAVTTVMTRNGLAQQSNGATTLNLPASRAPFMAGLYETLSGALAGDWHALEKDFTVVKSGDDAAWTLLLTPKQAANADMPIAAIKIAGAQYVERVEITKSGGDQDVLTFLEQSVSQAPLSAAEQNLLKGAGQP